MADEKQSLCATPATQIPASSAKSPQANSSHKSSGSKSPGLGPSLIVGGRTSPARDHREGSPSQKEREQRVRVAREKREEERHKKLDEIKQASLVHENYRNQLDEERRRRIDEAKNKDSERITAVQERRKQIFDAEMERREALLKRKMEREAKLEAKKNAQRNAMSFAFGSSTTPRLYDSYEVKASQSTANLASPNVPARRSVSLNRQNGEDLMTKSCSYLSLSSPYGRGRRKTDLRPTIPRDRDTPVVHRSPATVRKPSTEPRPKSSMSDHSTPSSQLSTSTAPVRMRSGTPHKPRPLSMSAAIQDHRDKTPRSLDRKTPRTVKSKSASIHASDPLKHADLNSPKPQKEKPKSSTPNPKKQTVKSKVKTPSKSPSPQLEKNAVVISNKPDIVPNEDVKPSPTMPEHSSPDQTPTNAPDASITSSGKPKITSEEEAKAALAERRRQAREQADKAAEEERIRQEKLQQEEQERLQREEAEARLAEAEAIRLAEEHRKQEEEKLQKAIEEKEKQEEEERKAQEEEAKLKAERDETERMAREEAERTRKENEERLKLEEEERAMRRLKVAAIMSRTRGKPAQAEEQQKNKPSDSVNVISDNYDGSDKDASIGSESIYAENNIENDIKSAAPNGEQLANMLGDDIQTSNCDRPQQPSAAPPVKQIDISMNSKCQEARDSSPQPGSLESSSSVNTVIFNGASDNPNISDVDSLSSLNKDADLQIQFQTNGHHISSSDVVFVSSESISSPSESSPDSSSVTMSPQNSQEVDQLIDLNVAPVTTNNKSQYDNSLFIEDLNSNIDNSPANPFISFDDNNTTAHITAKTQDNSAVADLLA